MTRPTALGAILVTAVAVSLAGAGGARAEVTLGASFGYTRVSYPDPDWEDLSRNVFGVPGSTSWNQPGLRVGYVTPGRRWDFNADMGLLRRSGGSLTYGDDTTWQLIPQIQVNTIYPGRFNTFANVGVGLDYDGRFQESTTRLMFGAGIGVRRFVSGGHGLLRVELRYDHVPEKELGGKASSASPCRPPTSSRSSSASTC